MLFYQKNRKILWIIAILTALKLVIHLLGNANSGFHRDELLYMAMADHPARGYAEVPPLIAVMTWLGYTLFGDSVFAMRVLPALASAGIVFLTGLLTVSLGGRRFSVITACLAMIISPAFLASGYLMQPVVFDQFFWILSALLVVRYMQTRRSAFIWLLAIAIGLGMLNKYTMALFAFALVTGIIISPQRQILTQKVWYPAALVSLLIVSPNLFWQIENGFPLIAHMKELKETQLDFINPTHFILQLLSVHATAGVVWLGGLTYLLVSKSNRRFRFLAYAFIITVVLLLVLNGKPYYTFGAFPMLFAAGGIAFEKFIGRLSVALKYTVLMFVLAPSVLVIPIAVPILSFPATLGYFETLVKSGITFPVVWEDHKIHATTQDYADMRGWGELAELTRKAYLMIPAKERNQATIIAGNYGQAGAIKHFGKKYGLPDPVSFSSSFALWSPPSISARHLIVVDKNVDDIKPAFRTMEEIGSINDPYAREYETRVFLLSDPLIDVLPVYQEQRSEALRKILH